MSAEEMKNWYDGYAFSREHSVYSPNSVMQAIENEEFSDYWTETETYESLKNYIGRNEDGLRDAIITIAYDSKNKEAYIPNREVMDEFKKYAGNILLVGINYDKKSKMHECVIERVKQ